MKLNKQGIRDLGNPNPRRPFLHEHKYVTIEDGSSEVSETKKGWPAQVEQCQFCQHRVITQLY